jgi:two-component system NtrC family sensor kinase
MTRVNSLDLTTLQHDMLLCADRAEPILDFLIRVDRLLLDFSGADAVENLIKEPGRFSRWEMQRSPERFYRLDDLPLELVVPRANMRQSLFRDWKRAWKTHLSIDAAPIPFEQNGAAQMKGYALFRTRIGDDLNGFVMYKRRAPFSRKDQETLKTISQTLAFAIAFQRIRLAQRERVKELSCLYHIGRATSDTDSEIDTILQRIVECLPPALQYPEITRARIRIDQKVFETRGAGQMRHVQRSDIVVGGVQRGTVEVEYVEERPDLDEGPFLSEERRLLDLVASDIALVVEKKRADAERSKLEKQVRRADRLATIGQLAAGVTHELNEPLGSILGFAQLAKKSPELPAQVQQDLTKIESATLHAREVVRKLMLFARQKPPCKTLASVNEIVLDSVALLEARGAKLGVSFDCRLGQELPQITADPSQITQVAVNLMVNAIQAMPEGGLVVVETSREGDEVALAVSDTGIGISEAERERIFDPFYTTKSASEGTGLGLAVVHGIVAAHRGRIEVSSKVGVGSQFRVVLPTGGNENDT